MRLTHSWSAALFFAYAKSQFSHDVDYIVWEKDEWHKIQSNICLVCQNFGKLWHLNSCMTNTNVKMSSFKNGEKVQKKECGLTK